MNELDQWCEIDGHEWNTHYLEHGLYLAPKTLEITKTCTKCKKTEYSRFEPVSSKIQLPVYSGNIIFC